MLNKHCMLFIILAFSALKPIEAYTLEWNPIKDAGNMITHVWGELKNLPVIGDLLLKPAEEIVFLPVWEAARSYEKSLQKEARGRWQKLPTAFVVATQREYPEADLRTVKFATNISKLRKIGASALTWGNKIYIQQENFSLGNKEDFELMLHELEHVVQYAKRGGVKNFLKEYVLKSISAFARGTLSFGDINPHNIIDLENAARKKERNVVGTAFPQYRRCIGDYEIPQLDNDNRIIVWIRNSNRLREINIYSNICGTVHRPDLGRFSAGGNARIDITDGLLKLGSGKFVVNIEGVETVVYDDPWKAVYEVIETKQGDVIRTFSRDILGYVEQKRRGTYDVLLP